MSWAKRSTQASHNSCCGVSEESRAIQKNQGKKCEGKTTTGQQPVEKRPIDFCVTTEHCSPTAKVIHTRTWFYLDESTVFNLLNWRNC
jgi:hypothetical protein